MIAAPGSESPQGATTVTPPDAVATVALQLHLAGSLDPSTEPFVSHTGPSASDYVLALNGPYAPIQALRADLERALALRLDHQKSWDPRGEAHVTTITPPEFADVLSQQLSVDEIDAIARTEDIQSSDLVVLGLGSGRKEIEGRTEETFFVIVDSMRLRRIRLEVWQLFVRKGGAAEAWDPTWFFPHVTVGYTLRDLHEPDVMKNVRSSYDPRFRLEVR